MTFWEALATIVGLGLITAATRGLLLWPEREVPIPRWLQRGLRYAPLAALAAVLVPEVLMTDGRLITTWQDARLFAVAAAAAWFAWRRRILGTIVAGTAVLLALRLGLGW